MMTLKPIMKKMLVSGLAATMLLGGSASVFADGKGKDRDHDRDDDYKIEYRSYSNNRTTVNNKIVFNGNVQIILNFDDVKGGDVEWAAKYIASLASKRVFEGYEDGTFQPRKPITRIEAITAAVRLMGLRDQAESSAEMTSNLNFRDEEKIKRDYAWATGYVAVAAENDLFLESDEAVQPEKPADRLWATTLLVKAMKLSAEAKAKMNEQLTFKDAREIPAGSVGYVKLAVEKGLINGYEDNTFRPNKPVTRAELAALLDRTGDQLPGSGSGQDQSLVSGKLTAAVSNNTLLVERNGQTTSVVADANAFVFRNGAKVTLADLQTGDVLKIRTYNNVAIFVEVTQSAPAQQNVFTIYGLYKDMTLGTNGKIATIKITQNINNTVQESVYNVDTNVTINGSLPATDKVLELKGTGTTVTQIKVL